MTRRNPILLYFTCSKLNWQRSKLLCPL